MKTKRKMIIAISALAMVILAGVVAVVAVLAAQNVTVKSRIKISYTSDEFVGSVKASYQVKNKSSVDIATVEFDGSEDENSIHPDPITEVTISDMSKTNNEVTFTFVFKTEEAGYKAKLTQYLETENELHDSFADPTFTGITALNTAVAIPTGTSGLTATIKFTLTTYNVDIDEMPLDFVWVISK